MPDLWVPPASRRGLVEIFATREEAGEARQKVLDEPTWVDDVSIEPFNFAVDPLERLSESARLRPDEARFAETARAVAS
jgi:hypothetical protein